MSDVTYPNVHVQLLGEDGNAFAILGRTQKAMRRAGIPKVEIDEFTAIATSGDYDHLVQTVMLTVNTDDENDEDPYDRAEREGVYPGSDLF